MPKNLALSDQDSSQTAGAPRRGMTNHEGLKLEKSLEEAEFAFSNATRVALENAYSANSKSVIGFTMNTDHYKKIRVHPDNLCTKTKWSVYSCITFL